VKSTRDKQTQKAAETKRDKKEGRGGTPKIGKGDKQNEQLKGCPERAILEGNCHNTRTKKSSMGFTMAADQTKEGKREWGGQQEYCEEVARTEMKSRGDIVKPS